MLSEISVRVVSCEPANKDDKERDGRRVMLPQSGNVWDEKSLGG